MSDNLVLHVDSLIMPESLQPMHSAEAPGSSGEGSSSQSTGESSCVIDVEGVGKHGDSDENEPLIQTVECRICQEEDSINNLETPCACSGSLKVPCCGLEHLSESSYAPDVGLQEADSRFAHRKCVQRWCNEKGDITCEICHQPYQPGYTAPPPLPQLEETTIDIADGWSIAGAPLHLHDPRILAMAAAERHFLDAEYDEYADSNASGAAFCRSAALILMALLLLRHAMSLTNSDGDDEDAATFFSLFLLRAVGFLLPCYIMAWAISILQRRRQRQEAAALAATEVAFMLQAGQRRGLHFTIAPAPAITTQEAATPAPSVSTEEAVTPRQESPQ